MTRPILELVVGLEAPCQVGAPAAVRLLLDGHAPPFLNLPTPEAFLASSSSINDMSGAGANVCCGPADPGAPGTPEVPHLASLLPQGSESAGPESQGGDNSEDMMAVQILLVLKLMRGVTRYYTDAKQPESMFVITSDVYERVKAAAAD